ncbi:endonuclease 8-like 1 [Tiliqua scincoides]|uniref:endonuclease 8-like 1 n=1 Tax=Tiliqua scincoides TaxID=71010 RepID=UPI003462A822
MPEGPDLFLTSKFINTVCDGLIFAGKVEKSEVSKNPEVPFESDKYVVSATSRGKELKLTLAPIKRENSSSGRGKVCMARSQKGTQEPMDLVFRFGMSGTFKLVPVAEMPKHAHLRFYTKGSPPQVLCFVDVRRFGRWEVDATWQPNRGPCVMLEYEKFRENVLKNLSDKAFNRPICEALLNQKFFNGIGNYLRAEILYRSKIPPFEMARTVLENLQHREQYSDTTLSKKLKWKQENPDLLELCHTVPMEVIKLGSKDYDPANPGEYEAFKEWFQCYFNPDSKTLHDANGRTIWFQGDPGPMAPKEKKSRKKLLRVKAESASPKVTKLTVKRDSKINALQEGAEGIRKSGRKKRTKSVQDSEDDTMESRTGKPNTRSRRKTSVSHAPPVTVAPMESQKRRASARKNIAVVATVPRAKRVKAK